MKLYKYRPLSDFLFKELFYQEIYFASYLELNDPLDLSARIEFTPKNEKQIGYLLWFLFKTTLKINDVNIPYSDFDRQNNKQLIEFNNNEELRNKFKASVYNQLIALKVDHDFISISDLEIILEKEANELTFKIDVVKFKSELQRLTKKFLENSCVTCFSETNNDFLMWSHYASKHSGICLEFTLENNGLFPYKHTSKRELNNEAYLERTSEWHIDEIIFWDRIKKVNYQTSQPFINFYDFSPVFDNEHDCDLIGLSKSWTHGFAYELENVFSTKTLPWKYENEWRAIEVNFGDIQEPEERVRHYPIECLSSIYFGLRTPESAKKRIYKIFKSHRKDIQYFDSFPTDGREIIFDNWEYYEE